MKRNPISLNQLSLPFGNGRSRQSLSISYDDRVKTFWFVVGTCLFSLMCYVYAVNATAHNVSQRAALEQESMELTTSLASLEFQYIAEKNQITPELASQYGFTEVKSPLYVSRDQEAASLSFNTQRP